MTFKETVVGRAMELAQRPVVAKVLANPHVGRNVLRAWEARARVLTGFAAARKAIADRLALATREDLAQLQRAVQDLEASVTALGARTRPADPAAGPAS